MLVMFTHGGTAETVEIKSMCHIANLQLIVAGAILFWLLEGAGAKISKVLVLVYVFDAMVSIFLAFIFGRALLFHYCTHEGIGLNTQLRTCGCIAQFWCQLVLGRFAHTTQTRKGLFFFKRTFFLLRAVRTASESTGKCVQSTEISVQFGPVRTKRTFFSKNAPFFSRPSVHPSKLFQQLAPQDQGEWMCSNPVYVPHKCRNVQMSSPAAHYKKQAKVLYFDTNCGSKAVQPSSFSFAPGSEWCVRVPDPTSDRTSTKRSHDLAQ